MRKWILLTALVFAVLSGCKRRAPENVAATVNDRQITYEDLERRFGQLYPNVESASEDELAVLKLETLRSLIDGEIMLQRAEKLGLIATDSDVESEVQKLRSPMTSEDFQRRLDQQKLKLDELKRQVRRELSIQKLLNKEVAAQISISEEDIRQYYQKNQASFSFPEPMTHLARILVTPRADNETRNLKNDNAETDDEAKRKILMIESRLRQGEDFGQLAASYSEDPSNALNGGDLGKIRDSVLEKTSPELRKLILGLPVGVPSPVVKTEEGYQMFKVFSREAAGQQDLSDPRVQNTIRQTLSGSKEQLLKSAYYELWRNDANIHNYYAEKVLESRKKA
jgi:peptidyl-prolyl cis-trans isomerase SurA